MRGKRVQAGTNGASFCKAFGVLFTMNSLASLEIPQKDKTLGEPPLGLGSPEVAHR